MGRAAGYVQSSLSLRFLPVGGAAAEILLRMQTAHDLWHAERKLRDEIRKIPEHAAA